MLVRCAHMHTHVHTYTHTHIHTHTLTHVHTHTHVHNVALCCPWSHKRDGTPRSLVVLHCPPQGLSSPGLTLPHLLLANGMVHRSQRVQGMGLPLLQTGPATVAHVSSIQTYRHTSGYREEIRSNEEMSINPLPLDGVLYSPRV